jgi:hypothetical protein
VLLILVNIFVGAKHYRNKSLLFTNKEGKINNFSISFVAKPFREKADKIPALLY